MLIPKLIGAKCLQPMTYVTPITGLVRSSTKQNYKLPPPTKQLHIHDYNHLWFHCHHEKRWSLISFRFSTWPLIFSEVFEDYSGVKELVKLPKYHALALSTLWCATSLLWAVRMLPILLRITSRLHDHIVFLEYLWWASCSHAWAENYPPSLSLEGVLCNG